MIIVTTPNKVIENHILLGMVDYLNKQIPKAVDNIRKEIQTEIISSFRSSRIYIELLVGDLRKHFGIPKGEEAARANDIIEEIANGCVVVFNKISLSGSNFTGGIRILIQPDNFSNLLSLKAATVDNINWLDWLLMQGDNILVTDFSIAFGSFPFSRSGDAVMIKNIGGFWKVPSFASGTPKDNWVTRILDSMQSKIEDIVEKNIRKVT